MSAGTTLLFGWMIVACILEENKAWIHQTSKNNCFRQPHQKRTITSQRISQLWMGGYYNEHTDANPRKDFDHMISGVACVERRINLIPEDPFIVLDIMDETTEDDEETSSTMRLAKYLVERREDLVTSKRVVVVIGWISLLVAHRLGTTSVLAWDDEQNETRLRIL